MSNVASLKENQAELELILATLQELPGENQVLRSISDRLIPHTVKETIPAIETQLQVVKEVIDQAGSASQPNL